MTTQSGKSREESVQSVRLYFTYPQPAAYFAWHLLTRRADAFPGLNVRWTPVLYRRLMALQGADAGGSPPLALKYMYADAARWAGAHGIPFAAPHRREPTDQTAHKVHLLAQDAGGTWEARWMEAMHLAVRRDGMDPTDAAAVQALANSVGVPRLGRLADPGLDERLEANTQQALRDEACDVPFLRVGEESFRGIDGLEWMSGRLTGLAVPPRL
ncbi:MAG: DsbA family protein [Candidatus Thermoplasmatota archaeon]|jgi:2-hydroxychromene-2-carboxylate isomerase